MSISPLGLGTALFLTSREILLDFTSSCSFCFHYTVWDITCWVFLREGIFSFYSNSCRFSCCQRFQEFLLHICIHKPPSVFSGHQAAATEIPDTWSSPLSSLFGLQSFYPGEGTFSLECASANASLCSVVREVPGAGRGLVRVWEPAGDGGHGQAECRAAGSQELLGWGLFLACRRNCLLAQLQTGWDALKKNHTEDQELRC